MSHYRLYEAADAGKDGYPLAWHETIKHAVREEAGHRCVRCKHPYRTGQHPMELVNGVYESWSPCNEQCTHPGPLRMNNGKVETKARILTVHHLDEIKLNCRWWNLAALCQRCHLTIQGRVKLHRPYFLEHSEWFKPYVAGFYASSILGEELSREQVTERMDELLLLARKETP